MALLGRTGLDVFPLCLGGNVFGWTADEPAARTVEQLGEILPAATLALTHEEAGQLSAAAQSR